MIKIIICGAAGRMGREIISAAQESHDFNIIAGVEAPDNPNIGKTIAGIAIIDDLISVVPESDCVIDFTNHQAALENLQKVKDFKKPFVTGTTGFSDSEMQTFVEFSKQFPIFLAPNMSVGVNHLYKLVEDSAKVLSDFDVEIVETHHRAKKDAPSGTARAIARVIKGVRSDVGFIYGREGLVGERKKDEVCVNSVRGGDVVGEHRVLFLGNGEFIELRHYATSRRCFAVGTLEAVRFIIKKTAGLYGMQDLLAV